MIKNTFILAALAFGALSAHAASRPGLLAPAFNADPKVCSAQFIGDYNASAGSLGALSDALDAYQADQSVANYRLCQSTSAQAVAACATMQGRNAPDACLASVNGQESYVSINDLKDACDTAQQINDQINP